MILSNKGLRASFKSGDIGVSVQDMNVKIRRDSNEIGLASIAV